MKSLFKLEAGTVDYINATSSDIASDEVVVLGAAGVGVAMNAIPKVGDAPANIGPVAVEGVYSLANATGESWAIGDRLYWDSRSSEFTNTARSNVLAGYAFVAAGTSDTSGKVKLKELADSEVGNLSQAAVVAALAGTLTGSEDGTLADVADIALSTGDSYSDAAVNGAVNAAILDLNLQLKELQTSLNAILTSLKNAGLMATS